VFQSRVMTSPEGVVRSAQTLATPEFWGPCDGAAVRSAGRRYWLFLRRFGRGLLRVDERADGSVAIYALGFLLLLVFEPPTVIDGGPGVALRFPIGHGLAVHPRRRGRGYLQMGVEPGQVSLTVDGYTPGLFVLGGLGRWLYDMTQSGLHVRIARGYLAELARILTGG
jgi:hypothetical protein